MLALVGVAVGLEELFLVVELATDRLFATVVVVVGGMVEFDSGDVDAEELVVDTPVAWLTIPDV